VRPKPQLKFGLTASNRLPVQLRRSRFRFHFDLDLPGNSCLRWSQISSRNPLDLLNALWIPVLKLLIALFGCVDWGFEQVSRWLALYRIFQGRRSCSLCSEAADGLSIELLKNRQCLLRRGMQRATEVTSTLWPDHPCLGTQPTRPIRQHPTPFAAVSALRTLLPSPENPSNGRELRSVNQDARSRSLARNCVPLGNLGIPLKPISIPF